MTARKKKFFVLVPIFLVTLAILRATIESSWSEKIEESSRDLEILGVRMEVINEFRDWVQCSWLVKIKNNTGKKTEVRIYVDYLNSEGVKIDGSYKSASLEPDIINNISGICPPFVTDVYEQIKSIKATVEKY